MAAKGFYGAVVIDEGVAGQAGHDDVPYGPRFGSPEWCRLFRYALDEASEHGLVMGLNLQNGWNLGGEYVTPEFAAKHLVYTSISLAGGQEAIMPQPEAHAVFYRDIAVLAFRRSGAKSRKIRRLGKQCCDEELGFSTPDGRTLLRAKVLGGRVVLPSGRSYRLLMLQDSRILSPEVLRHLEILVRKGALVLGDKPEKALTLRPSEDFRVLADKLWGDGTPGIRRYGCGSCIPVLRIP